MVFFKPTDAKIPRFSIGLLGLLLGSLALRFWGLSRFNTLVFDEVYYANFARGYLNGVQEFGGHPPLSNYLIAWSIQLAQLFPGGHEGVMNGLTGMLLTPFSYRWLNAFTGSFIPLVVAGIALQLTHRRSYALIAGLFSAVDGLFLVESRYALNNIYLVLFGLLGHFFLLLALNQKDGWRMAGVNHNSGRSHHRFWFALFLLLAGCCLGGAIAIKWNGAGFLLGAYLVWAAVWVIHWLDRLRPGLLNPQNNTATTAMRADLLRSPLENMHHLHLGHVLFYLGLVPFLCYRLTWIPYMRLDTSTSFWQWQAKVLDYHNRVGGMDAHPYCSPWYQWPLMIRPIAYFYKTAQAINEPVPIVGPPLPQELGSVIYDVHAIGNPILWWFSTAAILLLTTMLLLRLINWAITRIPAEPRSRLPLFTPYVWTVLYLVLNWLANWLPWAKVSRCTFLYHYMGASVFSSLAIALLVHRWLRSSDRWQRMTGISIIFLVLLAFVFWLPFYLGLPLSPEGLIIRRWLPTWV
jgi:dolichyl-phosphate-mannose--protein O-mannosyl transferase